jgi:hypothetical protein
MAQLMGRTRDATRLYLDLFFEPGREAAAVAEIVSFPLGDWWNPDNPALIDEFGLPTLLAAAGAHDEALQLLRRYAAEGDYYALSLVRASRNTGGFTCLPEVQAFYAGLGLPPLPNPPDC